MTHFTAKRECRFIRHERVYFPTIEKSLKRKDLFPGSDPNGYQAEPGPYSCRSRHDHHHACRTVRHLRSLLHVSLRTISPHYRMLHIPPYPPFKHSVFHIYPSSHHPYYTMILQPKESQSAAPTDRLHTTQPIADRPRPSTASTNGYRPHPDTDVSGCGPNGEGVQGAEACCRETA